MRTELLKMPNLGPNVGVWAGWLGHLRIRPKKRSMKMRMKRMMKSNKTSTMKLRKKK
jgi:hypothetical protein